MNTQVWKDFGHLSNIKERFKSWCPYIENIRRVGDFWARRQSQYSQQTFPFFIYSRSRDWELRHTIHANKLSSYVKHQYNERRGKPTDKKLQSPQSTRSRRYNSASNERTLRTCFLHTYYDVPEVLRNWRNPVWLETEERTSHQFLRRAQNKTQITTGPFFYHVFHANCSNTIASSIMRHANENSMIL